MGDDGQSIDIIHFLTPQGLLKSCVRTTCRPRKSQESGLVGCARKVDGLVLFRHRVRKWVSCALAPTPLVRHSNISAARPPVRREVRVCFVWKAECLHSKSIKRRLNLRLKKDSRVEKKFIPRDSVPDDRTVMWDNESTSSTDTHT